MFKIYGILKRHFEQLHDEVIEAIFTYEHSEEKFEFTETPTHIMSQDIEVGIGEKKYNFTLSVSMLSGEDQRTEQVKAALEEIEENPNIKFQ